MNAKFYRSNYRRDVLRPILGRWIRNHCLPLAYLETSASTDPNPQDGAEVALRLLKLDFATCTKEDVLAAGVPKSWLEEKHYCSYCDARPKVWVVVEGKEYDDHICLSCATKIHNAAFIDEVVA